MEIYAKAASFLHYRPRNRGRMFNICSSGQERLWCVSQTPRLPSSPSSSPSPVGLLDTVSGWLTQLETKNSPQSLPPLAPNRCLLSPKPPPASATPVSLSFVSLSLRFSVQIPQTGELEYESSLSLRKITQWGRREGGGGKKWKGWSSTAGEMLMNSEYRSEWDDVIKA